MPKVGDHVFVAEDGRIWEGEIQAEGHLEWFDKDGDFCCGPGYLINGREIEAIYVFETKKEAEASLKD